MTHRTTDKPMPNTSADNANPDNASVTNNQRLTLRQQAFARAYTDIDTDTYDNGTQSALHAYPNQTYESAASTASSLLRLPKVQAEIKRLLDLAGANDKVRMDRLAEIVTGHGRYETVTEQQDAIGNVTSKTVVVKGPTPDQIVRANHLINKMDGTYAKVNAVGKAYSEEVEALMKKYRKGLQEGKGGGASGS